MGVYGQKNHLTINAELFPDRNYLKINQEILFHNKTQDTLSKIILRNWSNSYKDNATPLAKRLLEDYKTDFYFSKDSDKGFSTINHLTINNKTTVFETPKKKQDLILAVLTTPLLPNESVRIDIDYTVKLPNEKFTGHGYKGIDYYLKDWFISPAENQKDLGVNTHKNLDYQHIKPTDFKIVFKTPIGYKIYSDLNSKKEEHDAHNVYILRATDATQADLTITFLRSYLSIPTYPIEINTNFISPKIEISQQKIATQKMLFFLKRHLGVFPRNQLLVEKHKYNQNPIYELKLLPNWLHPYSDQFKWEAEFFKALTTEYISQTLAVNKREDYWFVEGLEVYLFKKYLETYYPKVKIIGRLSNIWGIKSMNIAKKDFIDKFSIVHQITARENLDQSLKTPLENLSNFNKKVISPYKAGLGFLYLEAYVGKKNLAESVSQFLTNNLHKETSANEFLKLLQKNSAKDISWFKEEWLATNKKIDHKIVKADFLKDSVRITIKNNRSIKTPVLIYGLKGKEIKSKTWIDGFKDKKTIQIANDSLDKVVLNYEGLYPEINNRNNWKNKEAKLFERPLQVKLLKDLNNPRKHQLFLKPEGSYNYYDGVILGLSFQNKAYIHKNFEYTIKPTFSTQSKSLTGGASFDYTIYPEKSNIYEASIGISGSNYHYDQGLNYNVISPFVSVSFKQKDLRALGNNQIRANFVTIDKEVPDDVTNSDENKYHLFKLDYFYRQNKLINDFKLNANTEIATKFTKLNLDFRYRHLTDNKRPIDVRFFGGIFLRNNTQGNYFSYNQHTPNDYLFELPYLGRSETSGILSQQYFKAQGGFVTQNDPGFANHWLTSINTSIGIWRWIETFQNVSLLKNRGKSAFFDYEGGIRLSFVPELFELYLPIYNKEGWVHKNTNYWQSTRFVVTLKPQPLIRFLKQQLF